MGQWTPVVGIIGVMLVLGATLVLSGPVGKALGEWIRGWSKTDEQWIAFKAATQGLAVGGTAESERLAAEVDELRHRLTEVEERLDFAERLLAKERQADRLAPPR